MDIKIKKYYYHLKSIKDGKYHIHLREEVSSPLISITELETPVFDKKADADKFVDKLNEEINEN